MFGYTTKFVGTFDTDEGTYVYVEEYETPSTMGLPMTGTTAAPTGSASRFIEFGPFDAETAQRTYAEMCQKYPLGYSTPALTI